MTTADAVVLQQPKRKKGSQKKAGSPRQEKSSPKEQRKAVEGDAQRKANSSQEEGNRIPKREKPTRKDDPQKEGKIARKEEKRARKEKSKIELKRERKEEKRARKAESPKEEKSAPKEEKKARKGEAQNEQKRSRKTGKREQRGERRIFKKGEQRQGAAGELVKPLTVYSFPRSGRTWLTHLWFNYAVIVTGNEPILADGHWSMQRPVNHPSFQQAVIPGLQADGLRPLLFKHDFSPYKGGNVAKKLSESQRLALILRDPVKVIESYFHSTRARPHRYPEPAEMSLSEFVCSERFGIAALLKYLRAFDAIHSANHHVVHYEDMRADAASVFQGLLLHAGHSFVDTAAIERAVQNSSFERLQAIQRQVRMEGARAKPEAAKAKLDPSTYRFRSASDRTELSAADVAYIREQVRASEIGLLKRYMSG